MKSNHSSDLLSINYNRCICKFLYGILYGELGDNVMTAVMVLSDKLIQRVELQHRSFTIIVALEFKKKDLAIEGNIDT